MFVIGKLKKNKYENNLENGKLNILMEYCDEGDLHSKILEYKKREKYFTEDKVSN